MTRLGCVHLYGLVSGGVVGGACCDTQEVFICHQSSGNKPDRVLITEKPMSMKNSERIG